MRGSQLWGGEHTPGGGDSKSEGPEALKGLMSLSSRKKPNGAGAQRAGQPWVEVRSGCSAVPDAGG